MSIQVKRGFGVNARISAAADQSLATEISPNAGQTRRLTVMASIYPDGVATADLNAVHSRLVAWVGREPSDADEVYLDPVSAYFGEQLLPASPVIDVMIPALRPLARDFDIIAEPNISVWFYLGPLRRFDTLADVSGLLSLCVRSRDAGQDTQGLKAV